MSQMHNEPLSDADEAIARRNELDGLYAFVFSSPEGRKVLADIVRFGGVFSAINPPNQETFYIVEGNRRMALYILKKAAKEEVDKLCENQYSCQPSPVTPQVAEAGQVDKEQAVTPGPRVTEPVRQTGVLNCLRTFVRRLLLRR